MSVPKVSLDLPTRTSPPRTQKLHGKVSPISPDIDEFRGIPYASVTGRWLHSILRQELPADIFNATHNGPKCPQPSGPNNSDTFQAHLNFPDDVTESEFDCLNLFIQRPSRQALERIGKQNDQLPVLVWIHGGGFGFGAGTDPMWDPTRLVLQSVTSNTPIIVASINYRLNIFGFLASKDLVPENRSRLNFGLQDQHLALKWIAHNISHFGGDPSKITIAGQSAGGASVHAHVLNAKTSGRKPLFRRAILMSGSIEVLGPSDMADEEKRWDRLCKKLNVSESLNARLEQMRQVQTQELVDASLALGWMGFDNVIDGISISASSHKDSGYIVSFDEKEDEVEVEEDKQLIRVLIGETSSEGSVFVAGVLPKLTTFAQISSIFSSTYSSPASASEILDLYGLTGKASVADLQEGMVQFVSDTMLGLANSRAAYALRKSSGDVHNTTVKEYSVQFGNPFRGPNFGAAHHCVDLIYLFDAFHDYLDEADKKEAANEDGTYKAKQTNAELTLRMQTDWLDFVTKETADSDDVEEADYRQITVYGHDRVARKESLETEHWIEQQKRLKLLQKNWTCAKAVIGKFRSI